jgi:diguanylate cyclase (GGDEF)-like protein
MANKCNETLRNSDIFGRLGGEEFAAVLPNTSERGALHAAENIRQEMANLEYVSPKNHKIKFTVSIGISMLHPQDVDLEAILHKADLALYEAKKNGRNRVELSKQESSNN